jgi:hypothetical protein
MLLRRIKLERIAIGILHEASAAVARESSDKCPLRMSELRLENVYSGPAGHNKILINLMEPEE